MRPQHRSRRSEFELALLLTSSHTCKCFSIIKKICFPLLIVFSSRKHCRSMAKGSSWCYIKHKVITTRTLASMLDSLITSVAKTISLKSSTLFSGIRDSRGKRRLGNHKTVLMARRISVIILFWAAWLRWILKPSSPRDSPSSTSARKKLPSFVWRHGTTTVWRSTQTDWWPRCLTLNTKRCQSKKGREQEKGQSLPILICMSRSFPILIPSGM